MLGRERPVDEDGAEDFDGAFVALEDSEDRAPVSESSAAATAGLLAMAKPRPRANAAEPARTPNEAESIMTSPNSSDIPTSMSIHQIERLS
jgi:hypothetical protein